MTTSIDKQRVAYSAVPLEGLGPIDIYGRATVSNAEPSRRRSNSRDGFPFCAVITAAALVVFGLSVIVSMPHHHHNHHHGHHPYHLRGYGFSNEEGLMNHEDRDDGDHEEHHWHHHDHGKPHHWGHHGKWHHWNHHGNSHHWDPHGEPHHWDHHGKSHHWDHEEDGGDEPPAPRDYETELSARADAPHESDKSWRHHHHHEVGRSNRGGSGHESAESWKHHHHWNENSAVSEKTDQDNQNTAIEPDVLSSESNSVTRVEEKVEEADEFGE